MSGSVTHGNLIYLSGQVPADFKAPLADQVTTTLAKVDTLLADAGTNKSNLLSAQIWVRIGRGATDERLERSNSRARPNRPSSRFARNPPPLPSSAI